MSIGLLVGIITTQTENTTGLMTYQQMQINKVGHTYFAIVEDFLTLAECRQVILACGDFNLTKVPAGMYSGWKTGEQNRNIATPPVLMYKSKFDKAFSKFNESTYDFCLTREYSHFVNEYETGQILDWHRDEDESVEDLYKRTPANRLSCSIFLNEDFTGGEFTLDGINSWQPSVGQAIFFPSAQLHRGGRVTQGTKYNYTVWAKGDRGA